MRPGWLRLTVMTALLLGLVLAGVGPARAAEEHDAFTLAPSYGDGTLTIIGNDFKPNERVTISAEVEGTSYTFTATADARGSFRLATGVAVPPGGSVALHAVGDQGTGRAAITSGPGLLPPPEQPPVPSQLPRAGAPLAEAPANPLLLGGVAAAIGLLSMLLLGRRMGARVRH